MEGKSQRSQMRRGEGFCGTLLMKAGELRSGSRSEMVELFLGQEL